MVVDKNIKVLVVDDSAYNRQTITSIFKDNPGIEVVGRASDGEDGLKQALFYKPDLITLDLNMPRLDGYGFLRILMARQPVPIIVISSDSRKESILQALELGAIDFVVKPPLGDEKAWEECGQELLKKIKVIPSLHAKPRKRNLQTDIEGFVSPFIKVPDHDDTKEVDRIIVIGSSTGGPGALVTLISRIPYYGNASILIAQHMPAAFTDAFANRLNGLTHYRVKEGEQGEPIMGGHIYIAPGGKHMRLNKFKDKDFSLLLKTPLDRDRYVPSVDFLFESAARIWKKKLLALVLTGMGNDGARGVVSVKSCGGDVYAESEDSSVIFGMPKEAWDTGAVNALLPLEALGSKVSAFLKTE